jgi:D-glycero-alpha-D-manno-heptose-7-phosphate kinase
MTLFLLFAAVKFNGLYEGEMIITRTPFRVSFVGGGSDLREFYARNGFGAVVSAAINKYMYLIIHPYFHDKIRLKYSKTEDVGHVDEIEHPIIRECLRKVKSSASACGR